MTVPGRYGVVRLSISVGNKNKRSKRAFYFKFLLDQRNGLAEKDLALQAAHIYIAAFACFDGLSRSMACCKRREVWDPVHQSDCPH